MVLSILTQMFTKIQIKSEIIEKNLKYLKTNNVTLIYAAKSSTINHAAVLENYIAAF